MFPQSRDTESSHVSGRSGPPNGTAFHADLHIHSKYSRACSRDCDLEHLAWWARRKGIPVVGTGDFTHPAWAEELRAKLVPAEPGLFRLRPEIEREVDRTLPASCGPRTRFMLSVEISTIYKRAEQTRKVHHLIYVPDFAAADRVTRALGRIGNLASDGRPILGLDSRDLLEVTLDSDPGSYLVPAHAWTPWFSVLGSKSGFDAVGDCYADLAEHIFAVETGLSADPPMHWRVSGLDRYTLVSNSDAHSPPMLGREASVFATELDYFAIRRALETGDGYLGTAEFFPEEGKYHLDGHRKCEIRLEPERTRAYNGRCPVCEKPLTVGVLHRVEELADRGAGEHPPCAAGFRNLVPLPEIVGEVLGVGPKSKRVVGTITELVGRLGPELTILTEVPGEEIEAVGGPLLAEGISRLRRGAVIREPGYDGEYGVVRLFGPTELRELGPAPALFDVRKPKRVAEPAGQAATAADAPPPVPTRPDDLAPREAEVAAGAGTPTDAPGRPDAGPAGRGGVLAGLDPEQQVAAGTPDGPLLIVAGPGTGKTRTLTHRIARLVAERGVPPEQCLAITFTRRAREEMLERLRVLIPDQAPAVTVSTFHALGVRVLREQHAHVGLSPAFRVADDAERLAVAGELAGLPPDADPTRSPAARRLLGELPRDPELRERYWKAMRERDLVDFDDLIALPAQLLEQDPDLAARYRDRFRRVSVDEYQDVDDNQYRMLRLLTRPDGDLTAIGDPDQAIYGFRGASVSFFLRFREDFPSAKVVALTRNYRSSPPIVAAARQAIAPTTLVGDRELTAQRVPRSSPARVGLYEAADEHAEASFVARTIDRLLGGSSFHSLDSGRVDGHGADGLSFADIAVLYRTDASARPVMEALTRAGVPFQKRSHDRLADRPGVRAVAREMPHHPGPLERRIKDAVEALLAGPPTGPAEEPDQAIDLRSAGEVLLPLAERCADGRDDANDLQRFLTELALGAEVDTWDPRADRVSLLTMHAAKGLEFPVVFLVGCEDGLLPLRWPGTEIGEEDVREERRLLFVGITRAQSHLYLSYACRRTRLGAPRDARPSPLLSAVDAASLERLDAPADARRRPRDRQLKLL